MLKSPCLTQAIENAEITTGILMPTHENSSGSSNSSSPVGDSPSFSNCSNEEMNGEKERELLSGTSPRINAGSVSLKEFSLHSSLSKDSNHLHSADCPNCPAENKEESKEKQLKCTECEVKDVEERGEIPRNDSDPNFHSDCSIDSSTSSSFCSLPSEEDIFADESRCNFIETLPTEIVQYILAKFLDRSDRKRLRLVCQSYRKLLDERLFPLVLHLREREQSAMQLEAYKKARAFLAMPATLHGVNFRGRVDLNRYKDMFAVEFANIQFLDLSYHDGVVNSLLSRLPISLRFLNIRGCNRIDNEGLRSLHYLESLEYLSIRACTKITDEGLMTLPPKLEELDIESLSKITSTGFSYFPPSLKRLNASCCTSVDDESIKNLPRIMHSLDFSNCENITDVGLSHLPSGLKSLNLSACRKITNKGISHFPKTLRVLDMGSCIKITDSGLKNLPSHLLHLDMPSCNITDAVFIHLPRTLIRLNLSWCKRVTGDGIKDLPSCIQFLDLSFCRKLRDDGLCFLPSKLTFLSLTYCPINGEGLKNLPPNIEHLSLNNCANITDAALKHLPKNLKRLSILHCLLLTNSFIEMLKKTSLMVDR